MTDFADIRFYESTHKYYIGDQELLSATHVISTLKQPFKKDYWAKRKAEERGIPVQEILAEWDANRDQSIARGNRVHAYIQNTLEGAIDDPFLALNEKLPEELAFDNLWDKIRDRVTISGCEWVVGDEELGVAGTVDAFFLNEETDTYHIWDWKTGKRFAESNQYQKLKPPFDDLDECELNVYSLQVSLYRLIIERNTFSKYKEIADSYIVHFQQDGHFRIYKALDLRERLLEWLHSRAMYVDRSK